MRARIMEQGTNTGRLEAMSFFVAFNNGAASARASKKWSSTLVIGHKEE